MSERSYGSRSSARSGRSTSEMFDEPNPFAMPSDEEVFVMREEERQARLAERREFMRLPVHEKTTFSSAGLIPPKERLARMGVDLVATPDGLKQAEVRPQLQYKARPSEKESTSDFLAKKREMFLVQMSLNTKREEILKLERRASERDRALKQNEDMLVKDGERFEVFIRENDQRAVEALMRADSEMQAKLEKVKELKALTKSISQAENELDKITARLHDNRAYKSFLLRCTPSDWYEAERRKLQWLHALEVNEESQAITELADMALEAKSRAALVDLLAPSTVAALDKQAADCDVSEDTMPLYFKSALQLKEFFAEMEESNLVTMERCQETEVLYTEVKHKHTTQQETLNGQCSKMRNQIAALRKDIRSEEKKLRQLEARLQQQDAGDGDVDNDGVDDKEVERKHTDAIAEVYRTCYGEVDANLDAIELLAGIERSLEACFSVVEGVKEVDGQAEGEEWIARAEKRKQKERRAIQRAEAVGEQAIEQERRIALSVQKAMEPVRRKTGKPLMFRSAPIEKKEKVDHKKEREAEQAAIEHIVFFGE